MPTFTVQASGTTAVSRTHPNTNYSDLTKYDFYEEPFVSHPSSYENWDCMYVKIGMPADTYRFKRVTSATLKLSAAAKDGDVEGSPKRLIVYIRSATENVDTENVTYNTKPQVTERDLYTKGEGKWSTLGGIVTVPGVIMNQYTTRDYSELLGLGARNGFAIYFSAGMGETYAATFYGAKSAYTPYLECEYADDNVGVIADERTPATGAFVDRTKAATFAWVCKKNTEKNQYCFADVAQTSAALEWRVKGSSTTYTINITGATPSCTVPANTFPSGTLEWRVLVTANSGVTTTSAWQEISTVEAAPSAKTVSPSGIVIDATIVNRFSWQHIISTGTAQTKADLQWSADGTTWNTLATVTGENQYYDVPANTFTSGTKYWRVRTYNTDGTASEWSAAAEFIAINAPSAPSIVIQSTGARPRITWQTSEQEAYQLTLSNGYASGTVYGTDKSWRSPVYLADGSYTVRVHVQNQYGLWSDWGSAALPVSHTEGEAITLTAAGSHVAALDWQTAGSYDFYIVERDGVAIARTTQTSYIDHTSIGSVTYQVRGCYANDDSYGLSSAVTVSVLPDTAMVCDLESGTWQRLPLSETILRTSRTNRTATIQTVHLSGLDYPVAERSEFRDRALQISCAFLRTNRAAALALEALVGRLVCAKTKQGDMAVGYITALEKNADEIMSRYSFEVTHIYRREAITLDP